MLPLLAFWFLTVGADYTVTIYNDFLSQAGRVHYDTDRWNKFNGLTQPNLIPDCKTLGAESGRWTNRDLNGNFFKNWPQNPSRHGYPDPHYLKDATRARNAWSKYLDNINDYGHLINLVWEIQGLSWPNWINKSNHKDHFPNNVDAAAEFVTLMVEGAKNYLSGRIPPYFEVINEPDAAWQYLDEQTVLDFHRITAQKLKSRTGIKVAGPTYDGQASAAADAKNFRVWNRTARFMDMSLTLLDFFSFHAYNSLHVTGNTHTYGGANEARLVSFIDMLENYAHLKIHKKVPLIISEYGRGPVIGIDKWQPSGLINFATVYQANGHLFTYLGLREFVERAIVFLLASEQWPNRVTFNWSLFYKNGTETQNAQFFHYWKNLISDMKFLRTTSQYTGSERLVASHVLANPKTHEMMVLLHNYGTSWQNVQLAFPNHWITATTGQSTCIVYQHGDVTVHSNVTFDTTKHHGKVGLPGESTCFFKFKTNFNFNSLKTTTEKTHYGSQMVIPIINRHAQTTVHLPAGGYHTAHLRIGVSRDKGVNAKPRNVTVNGFILASSYSLYDSDKQYAQTSRAVLVYSVPEGHVKASNRVSMTFAENGGHVTSVAMIVGKQH